MKTNKACSRNRAFRETVMTENASIARPYAGQLFRMPKLRSMFNVAALQATWRNQPHLVVVSALFLAGEAQILVGWACKFYTLRQVSCCGSTVSKLSINVSFLEEKITCLPYFLVLFIALVIRQVDGFYCSAITYRVKRNSFSSLHIKATVCCKLLC